MMRYLLPAILICALGAPVASALPMMQTEASLTTAYVLAKAAPRSAARAKSGKAAKAAGKVKDYGIHPLVGSGGY